MLNGAGPSTLNAIQVNALRMLCAAHLDAWQIRGLLNAAIQVNAERSGNNNKHNVIHVSGSLCIACPAR